jgi:hypothetical protein
MNEELATFTRLKPLKAAQAPTKEGGPLKARVQAAKSTGKEHTATESGRSSSLLTATMHPSSRCCNVIPKRRKSCVHPRPIPSSIDANWRCLEQNGVSRRFQACAKRRQRATRTCDSAVFRAVLQQIWGRRDGASSRHTTCSSRRDSTKAKNGAAQLLDTPITPTDSPRRALRNFG